MTGDAAGGDLRPLAVAGELIARTSIGRIVLFVGGLLLFPPSALLVWALMGSGIHGPGTAIFVVPLIVSVGSLFLSIRGHFRARAKQRREARRKQFRLLVAVGVAFTLVGAALTIFFFSRREKKEGKP